MNLHTLAELVAALDELTGGAVVELRQWEVGGPMNATSDMHIVFLFEDEVREAGRRLATLRELRASNADDAVLSKAIVDALNICMAAFAGAENDAACLPMVRKPDLGLITDGGTRS